MGLGVVPAQACLVLQYCTKRWLFGTQGWLAQRSAQEAAKGEQQKLRGAGEAFALVQVQ